MSFEDYVHDMTQKYRLALAISVLKSKPSDLSIEQHIEKLKTKYQNVDMEIDDLNISIRSEDFNIDEDEIEAINCAFSDSENVTLNTNVAGTCDSPTILVDIDKKMTGLDRQNEEDTSFTEVMETLRDIEEFADKDNVDPSNKVHYYEDTQLFNYTTTNILIGNTSKNILNIDLTAKICKENPQKPDVKTVSSDKDVLTSEEISSGSKIIDYKKALNELETSIIAKVDKRNNIDTKTAEDLNLTAFTQNFTHVSQSQYDNIDIPLRHLYGNQKNTDKSDQLNKNTDASNISEDTDVNIHTDFANTEIINDINNFDQYDENYNCDKAFDRNTGSNDKNHKESDKTNYEIDDIEEDVNVCMEPTADSFQPFQSNDTMFMGIPSNNNEDENILTNQIDIEIDRLPIPTQNTEDDLGSQCIEDEETYIPMFQRQDSMIIGPEEAEISSKFQNKETNNNDEDTTFSNAHLDSKTNANDKVYQFFTQATEESNTNMLLNKIDSSQISYIIDNNGKMYRIVHAQEQNLIHNESFDQKIGLEHGSQRMIAQFANSKNNGQNFGQFNQDMDNETVDTNDDIQYYEKEATKQANASKEVHKSNTREGFTQFEPSNQGNNEMQESYNCHDKNINYTNLGQERTKLNNYTQPYNYIENGNVKHAANELVNKNMYKTNTIVLSTVQDMQKQNNLNTNTKKGQLGDIYVSKNTQEDITQNTQEDTISHCTQETQYENNIEQELTHSQTEVVSFKVLEELNRIKIFLNRNTKNDSLSDSGYKSDSQKSLVNASQSINWVNQSGHCLFNYILDCQLIGTTDKITTEISQVLARLIDRFHEDEHYPSFLAAILEGIDKMADDLTGGQNYGEHVLLKKDETIQRLCLLNKSVHILKYTIEKITLKLEIIHKNLTNTETTYEITNTDNCENICYIFHILEIFLERYIKVKEVLSQDSTGLSQEDKILKKSSITDMWRKKWIPNYKENVISNIGMEKQCILVKCSEVLNKIIVSCMEGYSLVSFAALQCFNMMQK